MPYKNPSTTYTLLIILAIVGYVMPWIIAPTSPLTLSAYDLAEWSSLHPSQPTTTPLPMLVPLLLRLQLLICSIFIGLLISKGVMRFVALFCIILLSIAQLPPLEFFISATGNINYQQQFILATISLIFGSGLVIKNPGQPTMLFSIFLAGLGVMSIGVGLSQAQLLYTMSLQENSVGAGVFVMGFTYTGIAILSLNNLQIRFLNQDPQATTEIKQGSQ